MRLSRDTFEVSEDFVRGALELAFKKVYENRRDQYKYSSDLTKDAIEFRYECADNFIENFLETGCFSIDPYDEIDSRFGAEELSYEEIRTDYIYPYLDEDEQKELGKEFGSDDRRQQGEQEKLVEERCNNNDYWFSSSYELAVQNCFNYSY